MATFSFLCQLCVILAITTQVLSLSRDPCASFVCQNGGSCTAPADRPSCVCQAGFFGDRCEYNRDPCFKFGCLNGGYCTAPADAPYCVCPSGFIGAKCETKGNSRCPVIDSNSLGVCGGTFCSSDSDCGKGSICCASACGSKLCTPSQTEVDEPLCPGGCATGYKCELKSPPCKPGMMCATVMVPTCVPTEDDECGGCPDGTVCKDTGIRCFTTPCPTFQCVAKDACGGCPIGQKCDKVFPPCAAPMPCDETLTEPCVQPVCQPLDACVPDDTVTIQPLDQCGGCSKGQVCKPTGIVCIRAPCPTHKCVAETAPAVCNLACARNYVCQLKAPDCPRNTFRRCSTIPVPQCVPKPVQLASCPKPAQSLFACFRLSVKQCSSDRDCGRSERCCPSQCRNKRQCTRVPTL